MNKVKEDSIIVLMVLFNESKNKQTLKINMSYQQILDNLISQGYKEGFDIARVKYLVEYISEKGWATYQNHQIFHDVCITAAGIDEYYNNFQ